MKDYNTIKFVDSTSDRAVYEGGFKPVVQVWLYDNLNSGIPDNWKDGGEFKTLEDAAEEYGIDIHRIKINEQWYPRSYTKNYIVNL